MLRETSLRTSTRYHTHHLWVSTVSCKQIRINNIKKYSFRVDNQKHPCCQRSRSIQKSREWDGYSLKHHSCLQTEHKVYHLEVIFSYLHSGYVSKHSRAAHETRLHLLLLQMCIHNTKCVPTWTSVIPSIPYVEIHLTMCLFHIFSFPNTQSFEQRQHRLVQLKIYITDT